MVKMEYRFTEIGFCQVHYSMENKEGEKFYYCLQEEGKEVILYTCTEDGEAGFPLKLKKGLTSEDLELEIPPDNYGKGLLKTFWETYKLSKHNIREEIKMCEEMDEKTLKIHEWMKGLSDNEKSRFAINWKMAGTIFNIACSVHPEGAKALQGIDWFKIYKSRDIGNWSHGGKVYLLCKGH